MSKNTIFAQKFTKLWPCQICQKKKNTLYIPVLGVNGNVSELVVSLADVITVLFEISSIAFCHWCADRERFLDVIVNGLTPCRKRIPFELCLVKERARLWRCWDESLILTQKAWHETARERHFDEWRESFKQGCKDIVMALFLACKKIR